MKKFNVRTIRKLKLTKGSDYILFIPTSTGLTDDDAESLIDIFKKNYSDVTVVFVESTDDIKVIEKKLSEPKPSPKIVTSDEPATKFSVEDMFVNRPTQEDVEKRGTPAEQAEEAMAETLKEMGEKPNAGIL
jgi:hypothetical protein